jgi:hypothetical protein
MVPAVTVTFLPPAVSPAALVKFVEVYAIVPRAYAADVAWAAVVGWVPQAHKIVVVVPYHVKAASGPEALFHLAIISSLSSYHIFYPTF